MKAIIKTGPTCAELVAHQPIPKIRPGYILVKTVAVAVNPTDWKAIDYMAGSDVTIGVDYSGIVEEVGEGVMKNFTKGNCICGFVHGGNDSHPEDGTHAEYVLVKGDVQMHIPQALSFEEASTLGGGLAMCGQALYQSLNLPMPLGPLQDHRYILIYGGSTSTAAYAIQFAKLSGLDVITTSSARNFEYCKSLGASKAFNHQDPDCGSQIRAYTDDKLSLVLDCISIPASAKICEEAISSAGGNYHSLLAKTKTSRPEIQNNYSLAYTIFGETFHKVGRDFPASKQDFDFAAHFMELCEKLLAESKIKPIKPNVRPDGLKGALIGIDMLRKGSVSAEKLVYRVAETP